MNKYRDDDYIREHNIDFLLPGHVGIIMDGNGRWAKKRLLPRNMGHREGARRLQAITRVSGKIGIDVLTAYAFSTENWKRSEEEVSGLMNLLAEFFTSTIDQIVENHVKIHHVGETTRLSDKVLRIIEDAENRTRDNEGITLNLAFNYGGRSEIVHAVRELASKVKSGTLSCSDITEQMISEHLYTATQPDPDVIIRTSGEMRLSNFMLYQCAYSEFMAVDDLWPDFTDERYIETLRDFSKRNRRFGGAK